MEMDTVRTSASDSLIFSLVIQAPEIPTPTLKELARRTGDFALAGVAVSVVLDEGWLVSHAGISGLGVGPKPVRLHGAEAAVLGQALEEETISAAAAAASKEVEPMSDVHADEAYRRHLVGVLLGRALRQVRPADEPEP